MSRRAVVGPLVALAVLVGGPGAAAIDAPPPPPVDARPAASWPDVDADSLSAEVYLLLEAATGQILAERDADERRAVASTVKLLTALTVLERADLRERVIVGEEVLEVPGSGAGLEPGQTWSVEQLLEAMIARSGNDAAEVLAVHVGGSREAFLMLMRQDAAALGLRGVTLVSPSGLDDANQLSARDLGVIARAALGDARLRPILSRQRVLLPSLGRVESRNLLLGSYPGATGLKTGFTEAAGYSLVASARRAGRELIVVVLGAGEDPARFSEAADLLDLGFEAYRPTELRSSLRYAVGGGSVHLEVAPVELTVPDGLSAELRLPLTARPPTGDVEAQILVGGAAHGSVTAVLDAADRPPPATGATAIGQGVADGAYAALRAATATGRLR